MRLGEGHDLAQLGNVACVGGVRLDDIDQPALQQGQKRPPRQELLAGGQNDIGARSKALEAFVVFGS